MMDVADFQDLLDRLGDDLSAWPDQARQDAELLLRRSEPARAALADAQALRRLLTHPPVSAPAGLVERIIQRARASDADKAPAAARPTIRPNDPDRSAS